MTRKDFIAKWISYIHVDAIMSPQDFGHDVDALVVNQREMCARITKGFRGEDDQARTYKQAFSQNIAAEIRAAEL